MTVKLVVDTCLPWTIYLLLIISEQNFDRMEDLPPGYKRGVNARGRIVIWSPQPRTVIDCKETLESFHRKGKFLDLKIETFVKKKVKVGIGKVGLKQKIASEKPVLSKAEQKIKADLKKITWTVGQLTLDPDKHVDHKPELENAARQ